MTKLMFLAAILLLAVNLSAAEEDTRLARQRHRVLHHRYPQTFRYKSGGNGNEPHRRVGSRPYGRRPSQTLELPNESRQTWRPEASRRAQSKVTQQQQHRRPEDSYGSPPVSWPLRPLSERPQQPSPHDVYGPPAELPPATSDDDIRDDGFRAAYEDDQYPEDELQSFQKAETQQQPQKPPVQQLDQYVGAEPARPKSQHKQPEEDKIENFEIPLEFLRGP